MKWKKFREEEPFKWADQVELLDGNGNEVQITSETSFRKTEQREVVSVEKRMDEHLKILRVILN